MARALRILAKTAEAASAAAFAAMFLLFLAGIFCRYALNRPLVWSDELIMIIFLWVVFLTEALVITEREQVTFDGIYDLVGERWRRAIQAHGRAADRGDVPDRAADDLRLRALSLARAHHGAAVAARLRLLLLRGVLGRRHRARR